METDHNPLAPDPDRDRRIRERAYHMWEAEGRPHGRDGDYWERARELEAIAGSPHAGERPNPATLPGADPLHQEIVDEAELEANLGEFPDRFADQGEHQPTPSAVRARKRQATMPADRPPPRPRRGGGPP